MRWPWQTRGSSHRLHLRPLGEHIAFVLTDGPPGLQGDDAPARLLRWGVLPAAKPIACGDALALLDPADYQILKVDTPNVPQEELKSAARWQIKEMVDVDPAELTLDVMHVGGGGERPASSATRQLFVVAARSQAITALTARAAAVTDALGTVDIWETALRNLLAAQARIDGLRERACAAVLIGERVSLLVVCAQDELFYTRRLEPDAGLLARARGQTQEAAAGDLPLGFEYQPGGSFDHGGTQESALVVELQRSIDVWERSWPDLPLARLYILGAEHSAEVAALIQRELGQRTVALDPLAHFAADTPAPEGDGGGGEGVLALCLPLLGAALRSERKQL
jgi:MSHA biogenesis protein MshI